jgi:hypothetical protein
VPAEKPAEKPAAPFRFLQIVDMERGVEVMSNKMIEKVVRIKKCGKCGYRIVLRNMGGLIDSVRHERYGSCIMTMEDYWQAIGKDPTRPANAQEVKPGIPNECVTAIQQEEGFDPTKLGNVEEVRTGLKRPEVESPPPKPWEEVEVQEQPQEQLQDQPQEQPREEEKEEEVGCLIGLLGPNGAGKTNIFSEGEGEGEVVLNEGEGKGGM